MTKPKTVKEWIEQARAAGHDALGIANDPEALQALESAKKEREMTVTPSQIKKIKSSGLDSAIVRIDEFLEKSAAQDSRKEWWISVSLLGAADPHEVIAEYRSAGWDVRYEYDGRDGDALVFKNPK